MLGESNTIDGKFTYAPVRFFDCTFADVCTPAIGAHYNDGLE